MRTIEISVKFCDFYGLAAEDNLSTSIEDDASESDVMTWATDLATEWFYNVAYDNCTTLWNENGGGTDNEFEVFFDNYIEKCSLDWSFKKRFNEVR